MSVIIKHVYDTRIGIQESKVVVSPDFTYYLLSDLDIDVTYRVRVTANTKMGEGETTNSVSVIPQNKGRNLTCLKCIY